MERILNILAESFNCNNCAYEDLTFIYYLTFQCCIYPNSPQFQELRYLLLKYSRLAKIQNCTYL